MGFEYKGKYYGVGTRVKARNKSEHYEIQNGTIVWAMETICDIEFDSGYKQFISDDKEDIIVEIIKPVRGYPIYVKRNKKKNYPSEDDLFCGWLIYIFVMIFVSFWKGNIWLWILITFTFNLWRNGELDNKED